jgi:acetyltransferase-like isoleucine patch superfamily enzyme
MKKEYKNFVKSDSILLVLDRDESVDAVSTWKKVKNPFVAPFRFVVLEISKLSFSMKFTSFLFRHFLGMKVGKNVGFSPIDIDPLCSELITIGDNCVFGWKSKILCHEFTQKKARFGKVNIGNNVLVGACSVIRSGVSIGNNSSVGIYSFVNKDIPANEMWGGVPAKKIRMIDK